MAITTALTHRIEFINTITHIRSTVGKVVSQSSPRGVLSAPDLHKISEGLFLSAITHWEEFCQALLITDLALEPTSSLNRDVKQIKSGAATLRLAEKLLSHIDHPNAFYDWSEFNRIVQRADSYLGNSHRFHLPASTCNELALFKRIRNSVAHKSDKAWASFRSLVTTPPFSLAPKQLKGITPGRFLSSHQWNGKIVLLHALDTLEAAALVLVP